MSRPAHINRYPFQLHDLARQFTQDADLVKVFEFPDVNAARVFLLDLYGFQRAIVRAGEGWEKVYEEGPKGRQIVKRVARALSPAYGELQGFLGVRATRESAAGKCYVTLRHLDGERAQLKEVAAVPRAGRRK